MKIPETSANVGAYYGNEENGQWQQFTQLQPNGVLVESGGAVGGGDARPLYPIHVPRNHIPAGYVMAGAYYGGGVAYGAPPAGPDDFADYMWMEHEEEFDKQVMQQLEEEALMEQCIEAMLEDEQRERTRPNSNGHPTTSNGASSLSLEETVSRSTLNPLAAEFVPTFRLAPSDKTVEKKESPPEAPTETPTTEIKESPPEVTHTEDPQPPQPDPPEVSAADVQPDKIRRDVKKQETKKQDAKKPVKQDTKKVKPVVVKSETKVQQPPKKKEVKAVKSESRVSESASPPVEDTPCPAPAPTPAPTPAPLASQPTDNSKPSPPIEEPLGPKPINYAAAAKANKPKKAPTPILAEKTPPTDKLKAKPEKTVKPEKPVQRKNSAK